LAEAINYLHEQCDVMGRETPPVVATGSLARPGEKLSPAEAIDRAGRFTEMGVIATGMNIEGRTRAEWCDNAERFGAEVIAKI
jgi:hypothetical protein